MEAKATISVCMIVRDEEAVIERCLKNAVQFADELIVVDTGSVDKTREIATRYTNQVYDYAWIDDFAAARNFSYDFATCDYVMWLDADDDIEPEGIKRILHLKEHMPTDADVVFFRYTGDAADDDILGDGELMRDRLVRNSLHPRWSYPIHEAILITDTWGILKCPEIAIYHRKKRDNEAHRNIDIFEKKMEEGFRLNDYNRSYYCRELSTEGKHEQAVIEFEKLWGRAYREDIDYVILFYIDSMRKLKRFSLLRQTLEEYTEKYGSHEMVFCTLGDLCRREALYDDAINYYKMAMEMNVDICDDKLHFSAYHDFLPLLGMAKAYMKLGRFEKADETLQKAEKLHPHFIELQMIKLAIEKWKRDGGES